MCFRLVADQKHPTPAAMPITSEPPGKTKPDAGVIATRPATAPDTIPSTDGLPLVAHSANIHASAAAAVATCVANIAKPARPSAATAEPALKPNQPTHSIAPPISVSVRLCGAITPLPYPTRLPSTRQHTRPAIPALMCTTVPPAKSRMPAADSQPVGSQTMCAIGEETMIDH